MVSIVIPNYCHARFLDERIQSVLDQTYQDFELIILDDCSQDGGASRGIIEQYRHDPHVSHIVYNDVNSGSAFRQWRKGMELAHGEYIWIAESDDSCDSTLLEKLVDVITREEGVMAFCRSVKYDEHGVKSYYALQDCLTDDFTMDGRCFVEAYLVNWNRVANASSVVFRRDAALAVDTCYMQMRGEGDYLFWIMLAEKGKVSFVNQELNYFRFHAENTTKTSVCSGTGVKEHKSVYDYLVNGGYLSGRRKHKKRMKATHLAQVTAPDCLTRCELMRLWDPYHTYRTLYLLAHAKGRIVDWIKNRF